MNLQFINDFQIDPSTSQALHQLLQSVFEEIDYQGRDYFKQPAPYRILAKEGDQLLGQMGIDYRAMNLNGEPIRVFGVVALAVDKKHQGRGIGTALMKEFEAIARKHAERIDFLFLVTEKPAYYERLGYQKTTLETIWLKIHQHQNYGLGKETITDAYFMVKSISGKTWQDGTLDLLGHMY